MKGKFLSLIMSVVMILGGFQACQDKNAPYTIPTKATISEPSTTEVPIETTSEAIPENTEPPIETMRESIATTEPTEAPIETIKENAAPSATSLPTTDPTKNTAGPTEASSETFMTKTVYATMTVNIRSGPGTSYSRVRTVETGTALNILSLTSNNWYRLDDDTYVSPSVVSDIMPTPTPTPSPSPSPTPSPTPDPNATPTPTPTPRDTGISSETATRIAKEIITTVRSERGLTTHFSDVLCARCLKSAQRCVINHAILNGTYESVGGVGNYFYYSGSYIGDPEEGWFSWTFTTHAGEIKVLDTSEEAIRGSVRDLIVNHVPAMATNAEETEFGVGIHRALLNEIDPQYTGKFGEQVTYYIYISCASPRSLECQIEMGWYD